MIALSSGRPAFCPTEGRDLAALAAAIYLRYLTDPEYSALVDASPEPYNALVWEHLPRWNGGDEQERLIAILEVMIGQGPNPAEAKLRAEVRRVLPVLERVEQSPHWSDFVAGSGVATLNGLRQLI